MANLKEIRNRISTVKNTQQVTKAMKMVSAAKLRRAQDRMHQLRPYSAKMKEIIGNVVAALNVEDIPSALVKARPVKNVLLIMVTSSRGLCGGFNSNLLKVATQFIQENHADLLGSGNVHVMCMGRKGYDYFAKREVNIVGGEYHDFSLNMTFEAVNGVTEKVFEGFLKGDWDKVYLVFNEFKNVMVQNRIVEPFLPLAIEKTEEAPKASADYIFEPNREQILVDLIPKSLKLRVFRAVLDSNAAEQGARMVAMDQATDNANSLLKSLKLSYNKARQAAITKEILEIAAGADALN
jgi:F-type H+-transporting ATPase subunit gamma